MELILTCLLVFFLPSQFGLHFWPVFSQVSGIRVDYLSPTLLFTDLLILPLIALHRKTIIKSILPKKYLLLILLILINIIFSLNPLNSLFKYLRLIEYSLLLLVFVTHPKYLIRSLITVFPLSLILINSLAWLQFFTQRSQGGLWYLWGERPLSLGTPYLAKITLGSLGVFLRPYSTFSHPNSYAGFLLVSALILYYLYRRQSSHLILVSLIFSLVTLPLTFSRTMIFLAAIFALILFIRSKLVFISVLLFSGLFYFSGNPVSFSERLSLINLSLTQIINHPLTGLGLGNFPVISPAFQPVHFLPLLILSELGLPFFLYLLYLFFLNLSKFFSQPFPLRLAWLVVLLTGLVDHYWLTLPQNLLLLFVLLSLSFIAGIHTTRINR